MRPVLDLRRLLVVGVPLGLLQLAAGLLQLLAEGPELVDLFLFGLPLGGECFLLLLGVGQFLFQLGQAFAGGGVLLLAEGLALDFQLHDAAVDLVQLRGHRVDLGAHLGRGLVHQVDGFVRRKRSVM